jgi:hypothetical protein
MTFVRRRQLDRIRNADTVHCPEACRLRCDLWRDGKCGDIPRAQQNVGISRASARLPCL